MKYSNFYMSVVAALMTVSGAVFAEAVTTTAPASADAVVMAKRVAAPANAKNCLMEQNSTVNVNFNGTETDLAKISTLMDAKADELMALAKQAGAAETEMQSMNYNINSNNGYNNCGSSNGTINYQWNGNVSLTIKPGDKAAAVAAALNEKKYNVNLNVNAYRRCQ